MFLTDKDLKKGRVGSVRTTGALKDKDKSTSPRGIPNSLTAAPTSSAAALPSSSKVVNQINPASTAFSRSGAANPDLLISSQLNKQRRKEEQEMASKTLMIQRWYRGRRTSRIYFTSLKALTEKNLNDIETVTRVLASKGQIAYTPPAAVVLDLLLSFKVLNRRIARASSLMYTKLLMYVALPSFSTPDFVSFVCTQESGPKSNPNCKSMGLFLWFLNSVVIETLQKAVLKKYLQPLPSSPSSPTSFVTDHAPWQCVKRLESTCNNYKESKASIQPSTLANINKILKTLETEIFSILSLVSNEVLRQTRFRDSFPSIPEFKRWIHLKGANFNSSVDTTILDSLLMIALKINSSSMIASKSASQSLTQRIVQIMEIPIIMTLVSPIAASAFFNEHLLPSFGVLPEILSSNCNSCEYTDMIRLKYFDTSGLLLASTGISNAHWLCGNLFSFLNLAATASVSANNQTKTPQHVKSNLDSHIYVYLLTCNMLLRKIHFPGLFHGKSGVFMAKTGGSASLNSNGAKAIDGASVAIALPILLQAQMYSLYDEGTIKTLYNEYFSCVGCVFTPPKGSEKDVKEIEETRRLDSGYRMISTQIAMDQRATATLLGKTSRWASALLNSISKPFANQSDNSIAKPPPEAASSVSSNTSISATSLRTELCLPIVRLLSDLWAVAFVPSGSDIAISSLPWQAVSNITHSTSMITTFWTLFLNQCSNNTTGFGTDFNPSTGFLPRSELSFLTVLVAALNIKLLSLDDEELLNNNDPLPLHQVLPLARMLNTILFKIISAHPSLFEEGPQLANSNMPGSKPGPIPDDSNSASVSKSGGSIFSSVFSFFSSASSTSSLQSATSLKKSVSSVESDIHPNNLHLFRYSFARSLSVILSDFYTRWSRRPFSKSSLWILTEANSSLMLKNLEGFGGPSMSLARGASDLGKIEQQVALSLLRMMPWSIEFTERMKMVRKRLDDEKFQIQGTNDALQLHMGAYRSLGTIVQIRRTRVVEDGIKAFNIVQNKIKDRIVVKYINEMGETEAGIDAGGLFKDLLCDLSLKVFNPHYGLFCQTSSNLLYPNPSALRLYGSVAEVEELYEFVGKVLGKAIYENITIQSEFAHFFLGFINRKYDFAHMLDDLKMLDAELHKNLVFLKHYDGDIRDLGLCFAVNDNSLGSNQEIELIPGGSKIDVTSESRHRYIHHVAKYYLHDRIKVQSRAFFHGLNQVVNPELFSLFCPPELQVLISGGLVPISVDEWMACTAYGHGYVSSLDLTIQKFWTVVRELDERNQSLLLKFVTSCDRPPSLGFRQLQPQFTIHREDCDNPDNRLPTASTCFNILKLPAYSSSKVLKEKLLQAIQSGSGFDLS